MRKAIPYWRSLVVLHVPPVSAEICGRRASILALMLDAEALGVVVITMLPFLLWRTPIDSASLLFWLPVEMIRSLSSLG